MHPNGNIGAARTVRPSPSTMPHSASESESMEQVDYAPVPITNHSLPPPLPATTKRPRPVSDHVRLSLFFFLEQRTRRRDSTSPHTVFLFRTIRETRKGRAPPLSHRPILSNAQRRLFQTISPRILCPIFSEWTSLSIKSPPSQISVPSRLLRDRARPLPLSLPPQHPRQT
jgi:hypothetical protein